MQFPPLPPHPNELNANMDAVINFSPKKDNLCLIVMIVRIYEFCLVCEEFQPQDKMLYACIYGFENGRNTTTGSVYCYTKIDTCSFNTDKSKEKFVIKFSPTQLLASSRLLSLYHVDMKML